MMEKTQIRSEIDKVYLTKKQVLVAMKTLRQVWVERGRFKNSFYILGLDTIYAMLLKAPSGLVENIVNGIFKFAIALYFENHRTGLKYQENLKLRELAKVGKSILDDPKAMSKAIFGSGS